MAENTPEPYFNTEDPLEALLDAETDEQFGLPIFKEHFADELTPAVLKDWSAQDFASIYVRFRPHLERHARRFLNNQSQVDEVVQDAFLYLMTTLPELDSELGVLKFLKWKTRLLSLDVIRLNSRAKFAPIDDVPEMAADVEDFSLEVERAEDAAIVSLALAKLQPRHREALIASVYEEKATEVVAAQMGLSENATRQLLFRARASFKKALIGEAETAGLSMGQILSIAARKAAQDSGKIIASAGAFLLVLAISIGVIPNFLNPASENTVAEAPTSSTNSDAGASADRSAAPAPGITSPATPMPEAEATQDLQDQASQSATVAQGQAGSVTPAITVTPAPASGEPAAAESAAENQPAFNQASFEGILSTNIEQAGFYTDSYSGKFSEVFSYQSVEIFGGTGVSAFLDVDLANKTVHGAVLQMWVDGQRYYAIARYISTGSAQTASGHTLSYRAADFYVADDKGRVFSESPLAIAEAKIELKLDSNGKPLSASIKITDN